MTAALFIVLAAILLTNRHAQEKLRAHLEARWRQPARTVNTFSGAGALAGLVAFGFATASMVIFPLAMAVSVKLVAKWGWLNGRLTVQSMRRPLWLLYIAAASPVLMSLLGSLGLMLFGVIALPVSMVYGYLRPGIGTRAQEDVMLRVAVALFTLLYCWLQNRAFASLTQKRFGGLAWQLVFWITLLVLCLSLLGPWLGNLAYSPSVMILSWVLTIYLLKQAGSVFGLWLARSTAAN